MEQFFAVLSCVQLGSGQAAHACMDVEDDLHLWLLLQELVGQSSAQPPAEHLVAAAVHCLGDGGGG